MSYSITVLFANEQLSDLIKAQLSIFLPIKNIFIKIAFYLITRKLTQKLYLKD